MAQSALRRVSRGRWAPARVAGVVQFAVVSRVVALAEPVVLVVGLVAVVALVVHVGVLPRLAGWQSIVAGWCREPDVAASVTVGRCRRAPVPSQHPREHPSPGER